jgi:hypothetical protein
LKNTAHEVACLLKAAPVLKHRIGWCAPPRLSTASRSTGRSWKKPSDRFPTLARLDSPSTTPYNSCSPKRACLLDFLCPSDASTAGAPYGRSSSSCRIRSQVFSTSQRFALPRDATVLSHTAYAHWVPLTTFEDSLPSRIRTPLDADTPLTFKLIRVTVQFSGFRSEVSRFSQSLSIRSSSRRLVSFTPRSVAEALRSSPSSLSLRASLLRPRGPADLFASSLLSARLPKGEPFYLRASSCQRSKVPSGSNVGARSSRNLRGVGSESLRTFGRSSLFLAP